VRQQANKVGSDVLVARANIVFVTIGHDGRPVRVPDEWRKLLPQWPDSE